MTTPIIEAVARALCRKRGGIDWTDDVDDAKAALLAIIEPHVRDLLEAAYIAGVQGRDYPPTYAAKIIDDLRKDAE